MGKSQSKPVTENGQNQDVKMRDKKEKKKKKKKGDRPLSDPGVHPGSSSLEQYPNFALRAHSDADLSGKFNSLNKVSVIGLIQMEGKQYSHSLTSPNDLQCRPFLQGQVLALA